MPRATTYRAGTPGAAPAWYYSGPLWIARLVRAGRTSSDRMPAEQSVGIMRVLDTVRERIGFTYPQEHRPQERRAAG